MADSQTDAASQQEAFDRFNLLCNRVSAGLIAVSLVERHLDDPAQARVLVHDLILALTDMRWVLK